MEVSPDGHNDLDDKCLASDAQPCLPEYFAIKYVMAQLLLRQQAIECFCCLIACEIVKYPVAISSFVSNMQAVAAKLFIESMDVHVEHSRVRISFAIRMKYLKELIALEMAIHVSQQHACQQGLLVIELNSGVSMKKSVCGTIKTQQPMFCIGRELPTAAVQH